jgi:hypothetical protein
MGVLHGLTDLHPQAPITELDRTIGPFTEGTHLDDGIAL